MCMFIFLRHYFLKAQGTTDKIFFTIMCGVGRVICDIVIITSVLLFICAINPSFFCSLSFGLEIIEPILYFFFRSWFLCIIESEKLKLYLMDVLVCKMAEIAWQPPHCLDRTSFGYFWGLLGPYKVHGLYFHHKNARNFLVSLLKISKLTREVW